VEILGWQRFVLSDHSLGLRSLTTVYCSCYYHSHHHYHHRHHHHHRHVFQALDEEHLKVDAQFGGVDQRKIFVFAEKVKRNFYFLFFTDMLKTPITSVSETIRKPPLVKAQASLKKIWRKTIFSMADGILTPCNVARL